MRGGFQKSRLKVKAIIYFPPVVLYEAQTAPSRKSAVEKAYNAKGYEGLD